MQKSHRFILPLVLAALCNISALRAPQKPAFQPGVYGVCNCTTESGAADPMGAQLHLNLNADNSFTYTDHTVPNKKVNLSGTWRLKHNKIVLENYGTANIHHTWAIDKDFPCIRSRNGLNWRRLCLVQGCGE